MIRNLIFFITLIILANNCGAQIYDIRSLDGVEERVKIVPDYPNNVVSILCSNDTIHIAEFTEVKAVTVLDKCFLEVLYSLRGGSNESVLYVIVISVKGKKLYQAANLPALLKYDIDEVYNRIADSLKLYNEHGYSRTDIDVITDSINDFKMIVNIKVKSKHGGKIIHDIKGEVSLNFDSSKNIFCNAHEMISEYFTIYDPKIQLAVKQHILGEFPVIRLGNHKFYYIKDGWYAKGSNHSLFKSTYK